MTYTYSLSPPTTDSAENIRLGYRIPRSILLPPYLAQNDYFVSLMDAVDSVFESQVDIPTETLRDLRKMWVTTPEMENTRISNGELIPFEAWAQPEWEILVKQVNMLGMKLSTASVLTNDNYQAVARWVGKYWFEKGTSAFIDFINYCLSTSLKIQVQWTQDYVKFYPAGSSIIGTPIWEGGTWYPTSHVQIRVNAGQGGLQNLDVQTLTTFFYEIANYNLVLSDIIIEYDMYISETIGGKSAKIVAMGLFTKNKIVLANF